ncbi:thiamine pyrophosphate-binding protein [Maribellus sediminis]|uniref:thiamine pyrophosphate-binding protein n=1 Tax=Maribellus sediminis TaxID=2696285 RepID=UPI00143179DD|nr:thiamine pyrophosphate-binding protein [Maribellus sediminis]
MQKSEGNVLPSSTVAQAFFHYLKLEGVTHLFGIPGGGLANLLNEIKNDNSEIEYIVCRQETGAGYAADGYYRATDKLGVVVVTSGPGATNALTGIMNAENDGSAVMLVTGEVAQQYYGKGYLQEGIDAVLDVDTIFKAATRYSTSIDAASDMQALTEQALRDALALPRHAVHLSFPDNVSVETLNTDSLPPSTASYRTVQTAASTEDVEQAVKALTSAKQPVIFLGNGCRQAMRNKETRDAFLKFVETYNIPVMTTADGKGIFPESHPLSLRVYGIASCQWTWYYLHPDNGNYDAIMVIGSSLGELSTMKWNPLLCPKGPFIQVDINSAIIGRGFPLTHGIVAEAAAFIKKLPQTISKFPPDAKTVSARGELIKKIKTSYSPIESKEQYESEASPLRPAAAMRVIQNTLPANSKIFVDAGNCVGWTVHYLKVDFPQEIFTALSMGPMGFAVGAVVGAKTGCPDDVVVCVTGDGAFLMQGAEVSTAARHKIGAIWIVLNDNDLAMVSQGQAHFFPAEGPRKEWEEIFDLGNPDLVKYAESLGADAYHACDPKELDEAMKKAVRNSADGKPQVVIMKIDKKDIPPYYNQLFSSK